MVSRFRVVFMCCWLLWCVGCCDVGCWCAVRWCVFAVGFAVFGIVGCWPYACWPLVIVGQWCFGCWLCVQCLFMSVGFFCGGCWRTRCQHVCLLTPPRPRRVVCGCVLWRAVGHATQVGTRMEQTSVYGTCCWVLSKTHVSIICFLISVIC